MCLSYLLCFILQLFILSICNPYIYIWITSFLQTVRVVHRIQVEAKIFCSFPFSCFLFPLMESLRCAVCTAVKLLRQLYRILLEQKLMYLFYIQGCYRWLSETWKRLCLPPSSERCYCQRHQERQQGDGEGGILKA